MPIAGTREKSGEGLPKIADVFDQNDRGAAYRFPVNERMFRTEEEVCLVLEKK